MRTAFAVIISLTICLLEAGCYAQSSSSLQSVGGDFGRDWISSFKAQNPQPAETNLKRVYVDPNTGYLLPAGS